MDDIVLIGILAVERFYTNTGYIHYYMSHPNVVSKKARDLGYSDAAEWIKNNPDEYLKYYTKGEGLESEDAFQEFKPREAPKYSRKAKKECDYLNMFPENTEAYKLALCIGYFRGKRVSLRRLTDVFKSAFGRYPEDAVQRRFFGFLMAENYVAEITSKGEVTYYVK